MAARSPAAIAAIKASSVVAPTTPTLPVPLGTADPVVCMMSDLPAALHRTVGGELSHRLFHLIYVGRGKWFRGLPVLFRAPRTNETIGRPAATDCPCPP